MKAQWLPDLKTILSFDEAATAMRQALVLHLAKDPAVEVLSLALAKTALETGRWKSMHRNNWGNIKAGEQYEGYFTTFRCNEIIKGRVEWFDPTSGGYQDPPGHPQCRFRAYQSAADGAKAYVAFVAGGRYAAAWSALLAGDAAGYVHRLKLAGYFTAAEAPYLAGVASLQREFTAKLMAMPHEPAQVDLPAIASGINDADRAAVEVLQAEWFHEQTGEPDETRSA